ncbi:MAG: class I SAM-dependent methyltransferase [Ignavibacteriales bacterium]|nr:class I SAM-dependent methyltransferase [Ignavibacteriales bacterium]
MNEYDEQRATTSEVMEQSQRVRKFFDSSDFWHGKVYKEPQDRFARAVVRRRLYALEMIRRLPIYRGAHVLDVGSGSGVYAAELMKNGFTTFAIDLSRETLESSRGELGGGNDHDRVNFLCGDVENLPVKNEIFDLILCVGVLGYLLKYETAIAQLHRVLKPGGYLLLNVENVMSLSSVDYFYRTRMTSLFTFDRRKRSGKKRSYVTMESPWVREHSPTGYRYYLFHPWKLERDMKTRGFLYVDGMTFGYPFRLPRKWRIIPEAALDAVELFFERIFRAVRVPYFSYSGETYTAIFQKT